jgi:hypothetical protein
MNDHTEIKGKRYRYDPDHDAYYRAYTEEEIKEQTKETLWILGICTFVMTIGLLYEIYVK